MSLSESNRYHFNTLSISTSSECPKMWKYGSIMFIWPCVLTAATTCKEPTSSHTQTPLGPACATSTKAPSAPASRSRVQSRARRIWHSSLPMKYFTSAELLSLKSGQSSLWTSLSQVALTHSEPGAARITFPFFQERVGLVRKISTSDPTSAKMVEILGVAELAFEPIFLENKIKIS